MIVENKDFIYVGDTSISKVYNNEQIIYEKGWNSNYQHLDYIENTRDHVIETSTVIKKNVIYTVEMQLEATSLTGGGDAKSAFAAYDSGYSINISVYDPYNSAVPGYNWHIGNRNPKSLQVDFITPDIKQIGVINTAKITFSFNRNFNSTSPMCLFSQSEQGLHPYPSRHFLGKIYYCKIWADGVLVQDLWPVKRKSDNVEGFFNKVDGSFITWYS